MSLPATNESASDSGSPRDSPPRTSDRRESDEDTLSGNEIKKDTKPLPDDFKKHESSSSEEGNIPPDRFKRLSEGTRRRLHFDRIQATGPGSGFNPTNARFHIRWGNEEDSLDDALTASEKLRRQSTADQVDLHWSSRYNRKGRNSFVVSRSNSMEQGLASQRHRRRLSNFVRILKNIIRMFITFPYWDLAFWSGWAYSVGSVLFVIDGAFAWVPLAWPYTEFPHEADSVGYMYFVGALLYEVGAVAAYMEAINDGSFHGSAMKRLLEGKEDEQKKLLDEKLSAFFGRLIPHSSKKKQKSKRRRVTRPTNTLDLESGWFPEDPDTSLSSLQHIPGTGREETDHGPSEEPQEGHIVEHLAWRWWPTWHNFKTHHIKEMGWWACSIQLFGATLYAIAGVVAIPGIIDSLEQWQKNAAYWIPEIVASVGFLTASILFMLETQEKLWKPEPRVLGWWVGVWATIGSCGFLLCGVLGPAYGSSGAQYQSSLSSTWGSAAYLMSGLLQWYEAVNKHPIEELFSEPGELKSFQVHPA